MAPWQPWLEDLTCEGRPIQGGTLRIQWAALLRHRTREDLLRGASARIPRIRGARSKGTKGEDEDPGGIMGKHEKNL
jgi:hypothetical protein